MYAKYMTTNDISTHIKNIKGLMADLKQVYGAVDEGTALYDLENFAIKLNSKFLSLGGYIGQNYPLVSNILGQ